MFLARVLTNSIKQGRNLTLQYGKCDVLGCCTGVETLCEKISLTESLQRAEMLKVICNHFLQKMLQVKEQAVALT